MIKKKSIFCIFLILISLFISSFYSINVKADDPTVESVFGSGATDMGTAGNGTTLQQQAGEAGQFAGSTVAEFKNVGELNDAMNKFFGYIRWGIAFLTTLGTISSFLILSMAFVRLANAPSAAFQRRNCYIDILKGGLSVICFGGLTLLMTIFYKSFSVFISKTILLSSDWKKSFAFALVEFKYLICGACGVLSLTMFIIFIKDILELASSGGNPQKRAEGIKNIVITGAATIGLGGVGIFVAVFNGLLA